MARKHPVLPPFVPERGGDTPTWQGRLGGSKRVPVTLKKGPAILSESKKIHA